MLSSQLVKRKQHSGDKLFHFPSSTRFRGCVVAEWVWDSKSPLLAKTTVVSKGKDISVRFVFLLPGSSSLFVSGLVKRFPLTNLVQTISSSAMKGNSKSVLC